MKITKLLFTLIILNSITSCSHENDEIYSTQFINSIHVYSEMEQEILNLVNNYRENLGLKNLNKLDIVSEVALTHSKHMAETGKVSHDNFIDRYNKLVKKANAKAVGENVGYGYNSATGVFNAWILSDSHRSVIENSNFTHFGISTERNSDGSNYFTQIFITQ